MYRSILRLTARCLFAGVVLIVITMAIASQWMGDSPHAPHTEAAFERFERGCLWLGLAFVAAAYVTDRLAMLFAPLAGPRPPEDPPREPRRAGLPIGPRRPAPLVAHAVAASDDAARIRRPVRATIDA